MMREVESPSGPGRPRAKPSNGRRCGPCARRAAGIPSSTAFAPASRSTSSPRTSRAPPTPRSAAPLRRRCDHPLLRHHHAARGDGPAVRVEAWRRPGARSSDPHCWPTSTDSMPIPIPTPTTTSAQLLRRVQEELRGELPVIVFAGAPFTVATYCIGTGKDVAATRRFAAEQPAVWNGLLEKLSAGHGRLPEHACRRRRGRVPTLRLLGRDADAGRVRCLGPAASRRDLRCARPACRASCSSRNARTWTQMCTSGADVVSLGTRHDLAAARRDYPHLVFQGNVDEDILRDGNARCRLQKRRGPA